MNKHQYSFFATKKRKPFGNNKPRVDWLRIIWKCHKFFEWPSKADAFAHSQEIDFGVSRLLELRSRQDSGQKGHKSKRRNVVTYNTPPDELDCDDPLYDGQPRL